MNYYLRLLCYDDPSRQTSSPVCSDMRVDELPDFVYGQDIRVGNDETDPLFWPIYLVGNIPLMQEVEDPRMPDRKALLLTVYLVKEECWDYFDVPERVQYVLDLEEPGHID